MKLLNLYIKRATSQRGESASTSKTTSPASVTDQVWPWLLRNPDPAEAEQKVVFTNNELKKALHQKHSLTKTIERLERELIEA